MSLRQPITPRRWRVLGFYAVVIQILTLFLVAPVTPANAATAERPVHVGTYTNPLKIQIPGDGLVESCPDPSIIHAQQPGDTAWYMYCTADPLNGQDRNPDNTLKIHLMTMHKSQDLVHWTYMGDVFANRPAWVAPNGGTWAPDIHFFAGKYYLYYTASDTNLPGGGSAIGVATSNQPLGPWVDSGGPVVEPHAASCCVGSKRWVYDPTVIEDKGQKYILYGSYFGGVSGRKLSADGLHSDPASQVQVTIANRYEGSFVMKHDGYFYLFASATNCCNGPLTGYSVFAGRSTNPLGPYTDKQGVSLLAGRVGGTPVISMNGNRWVGTGHNAVFQDFDGNDWFLYHAVDRTDPYFAGATGFTKRPVLMDRLDWIGGWPTVRAGRWASDTPQEAPAAQPGQESYNHDSPPASLEPGNKIMALSDDFQGKTLSSQWSWVRQPAAGTYGQADGSFRFDTQNADLYVDSNNASVLTEPTPTGDYVVETKVKLSVPAEGCCQNFVQAGLVIYGDDDNFIKLAHASIYETRQTEFAKELSPVPSGYPRYGNTVVGPPGDSTWLRIVKRNRNGEELYTAFTSNDGKSWVRGGTWTHKLGATARIGLISMGGSGFTANFDYVRVFRLDRDFANVE